MEHATANQVLVSEPLRRATGDGFTWQALGPIKAKGKAEPVPVFALVGLAHRSSSRLYEPKYASELVGRGTELARLEQTIGRIRAGEGQVLCISGEAGMGKSRLVAEAVRLAKKSGLKIFQGECQSHGTHASYLPWQSIWQDLFGLDTREPAGAQTKQLEQCLAQIDPLLPARLPLLGTILNLSIPENEVTRPLEARLRKSSLEALLVSCLRSLAERDPLVLIIEDAHWIDSLSYDLLDVLARSILRSPALLLFTQRSKETGYAQVHGLEHLPYFAEMALSAFTQDEAARMIQVRLAELFNFTGSMPPELVGRLLARSAGNPFYLEELLNFLRNEKVDFENPVAVQNLELPTSLHSLVLSRIDRLSETQQASLKVASVVGRLFSSELVCRIQPERDRQKVVKDLGDVCEADLTAIDQPEPELVYIFKHVVTQEVTYESLAHATRSRLHNEIGLCLELLQQAQTSQGIDLLAFHFDRSLNIAKKRQYLRLAGQAAQANYANAAAISYYERALPLLDPVERIEVLLNLGKVRELTGEWKRAGACYQQAFEVAEGLNEHSAKARCQAATGDLLRKQGFYADATNWLGIARTAFEEINDQAGVGQTVHAMGTVAAMQGDYPQARSFYEQSLVIRRRLGDKTQIASLLSNLGIIARFNAEYPNARELMQQSLEIRRELGDRWAIANSLNNLGVLLRDISEFASARGLLEESLLLNRQVGDRWATANTLSSLGEVAIDLGDWPAAHGFLGESLKINLDLGDRTAVAFVLECFAIMAARQGAVSRAFQLAGAASNLRTVIGSPLSPAEQERLDKALEQASHLIQPGESKNFYEQGARLTLEQAIAIAVSSIAQTPAAS
jgi:predicted ATPase